MRERAVHVTDVEVQHPETGEMVTLNVRMNPSTKTLVAIANMELPADRNSILDPYGTSQCLHFHDTFTGLPK